MLNRLLSAGLALKRNNKALHSDAQSSASFVCFASLHINTKVAPLWARVSAALGTKRTLLMRQSEMPKALLALVVIYTIYSLFSLITMSNIYASIIPISIAIGISSKFNGALVGLRIFVILQFALAGLYILNATVFTVLETPKAFKSDMESAVTIAVLFALLAFQYYVAWSKEARLYVERT